MSMSNFIYLSVILHDLDALGILLEINDLTQWHKTLAFSQIITEKMKMKKKSVCLHDLDDKKLKNTRPVRKERSLQIGKNLPPLSKISKLLGLTLFFNAMANYYNTRSASKKSIIIHLSRWIGYLWRFWIYLKKLH